MPIVIRLAAADDAVGLERLADLDSARPPTGPVLVAEQGGALCAALELDTGRVVADPFVDTTRLVALLRAHEGRRAAPPAVLRGRRILPRLAFRAG